MPLHSSESLPYVTELIGVYQLFQCDNKLGTLILRGNWVNSLSSDVPLHNIKFVSARKWG
jgi:hypothetical protein